MSDVILHVKMTPLTVEDRLLIDFANWKRLDCWKIITEFPARQWKWHAVWYLTNNWIYMYCLRQKAECGNRRRSEWTDSNIKSINSL